MLTDYRQKAFIETLLLLDDRGLIDLFVDRDLVRHIPESEWAQGLCDAFGTQDA
jgi:hypothetical protein